MKYVLLGTLSSDWATKHAERVAKARAKLEKLGIRLMWSMRPMPNP
jgi:hypothetical protein